MASERAEVLAGNRLWWVDAGDATLWLNDQANDSIDLLLTSPPYLDARTYGIGFDLGCPERWAFWMQTVVAAAAPKVKGLIAVVCEGRTEKFAYKPGPAILEVNLYRTGFKLRKPPAFHRVGIPGSGGPDWLRNDYEPIICISRGKLPWSDNTACGEAPKYQPGGEMSYRNPEGARKNQRHRKVMARLREGTHAYGKNSHYTPPEKANPGNVLKYNVGGGRMGHDLAHENEAPFPLALCEFFVKSFCPPGGIVADCFAGSGTTGHAAIIHGRRFIGCDIRPGAGGQDTATRRLADVEMQLQKQRVQDAEILHLPPGQ